MYWLLSILGFLPQIYISVVLFQVVKFCVAAFELFYQFVVTAVFTKHLMFLPVDFSVYYLQFYEVYVLALELYSTIFMVSVYRLPVLQHFCCNQGGWRGGKAIYVNSCNISGIILQALRALDIIPNYVAVHYHILLYSLLMLFGSISNT